MLAKQTALLDIERQVIASYPSHSAWLARRLGVSVRTCHWIIEGAAHPLISSDRSKLMQSPMSVRMLAVADAASAMLSDRPYRPRLSVEQMLRELRAQQDHHFDAKIVDAMHRIAPSVHGIAA